MEIGALVHGGCLALRTRPWLEQCPQPAHLFHWQMCCTAWFPQSLSHLVSHGQPVWRSSSHVSETVSALCSGASEAQIN